MPGFSNQGDFASDEFHAEVYKLADAARACTVELGRLEEWIADGLLQTCASSDDGSRVVRAFDLIAALTRQHLEIPPALGAFQRHVLIAEDDRDMANAIARLLRHHGFIAMNAPDGFQAGSMLESFCPSVVILDMNMPYMRGIEVLQHIRGNEEYSHIKVIVVSAAETEVLDEAREMGAECVIAKPFDNDDLVNKVCHFSGLGRVSRA